MKRILGTALLLAYLCALPLPASAVGGPTPNSAVTTGDFDGDGIDDLAVGVPGEDVGDEGSEISNAGAVNVIYGSSDGLSSQGDQVWHQDSSPGGVDVEDAAEEGDQFGTALAAGDFNRDGFEDLAVGIPFEDLTPSDAGAVQILYGSASGLTADGMQTWTSGSVPSLFTSNGDNFGNALAVGDFGRSRPDDLAIGIPKGEAAGIHGGLVLILSGKAGPTNDGGGLALAGNRVVHQDVDGVAGATEANDLFGFSLAAADFGGSLKDDLAVGVPFETIETEFAGAVLTFSGSKKGIDPAKNQMWHRDVPYVKGDLGSDLFGWDVVAADFGKGERADLAISAPQSSVGSEFGVGSVSVLYGSPGGLTTAGNQLWHPGLLSVEGEAESSTFWGGDLAAGDLGRSTHADLAIGWPRTMVGTDVSAGAVNILHGSSTGVTAVNDQIWHQDSDGVSETSAQGDQFGAGLAIGDVGRSEYADLAVAVPREGVDGEFAAGAVNLLYGSSSGVRSTGDQTWHQNSPDIEDASEELDTLGGIV